MLRSISKDAHLRSLLRINHHSVRCRSTRNNIHLRYTFPSQPALRSYSQLTPSTNTPRDPAPVPSTSTGSRAKVDLRPKPRPAGAATHPRAPPSSSSHVPNAPIRQNPATVPEEHLTLGKAKEAVQNDLKDAEEHGIMKPPPPGAGWAKTMLHKVIELAKFYYRGVKLIFTRRKEIAAIHARVKAGGAPMTRAEFRMVVRQRDDVNKVIPFIIIALFLEEIIPLIAIYVPSMLPSTCILPSQRERIDAKRREKATAAAIVGKENRLFDGLKARVGADSGGGQITMEAVSQVGSAPETLCSVLGLSSLGPDALRTRRIRKHLAFIAEDDQHLRQDQLVLSELQVKDALAERGLFLASKATPREHHNLLNWWLKETGTESTLDAAVTSRLSLIISRF